MLRGMDLWQRLRRFWTEVNATPAPVVDTELVVSPELTRPDPLAAAHVSAAREALHQGRLDDCAEAALAALERSPHEVMAAFLLGHVRLRQQRLEEALVAFELAGSDGDPFGLAAEWQARVSRLLAADARPVPTPTSAEAIELERAARAALRAGEPEQAAQLAAQAAALDPANLLAHHLVGQALLTGGRLSEALAAFEAARPFELSVGLVDSWITAALEGPTNEAAPLDEDLDESDMDEPL